jgi:hypothetical protein
VDSVVVCKEQAADSLLSLSSWASVISKVLS